MLQISRYFHGRFHGRAVFRGDVNPAEHELPAQGWGQWGQSREGCQVAIAGLNGNVAGGILAIVDFVGSVARLIVKEMIVRIAAGGGDGLGGAFDGRAQFGAIVERGQVDGFIQAAIKQAVT
jgi:hypothetical protein